MVEYYCPRCLEKVVWQAHYRGIDEDIYYCPSCGLHYLEYMLKTKEEVEKLMPLKTKQKQAKKNIPILRGVLKEQDDGSYRIALWETDRLKEVLKKWLLEGG